MTFYFILTISQHFLTTFLASLQFLQSTGCFLNCPSVKFVDHDLTAGGNCPAQSKFNLIKDWSLPIHDTIFLSSIGMGAFYSCYCPWFETNIKPFRPLQRSFHHAPIPVMAWSSSNISIFVSYKSNLISSFLLLRYDSSKLVFLKTGWSANGIGHILMQPDNCSESLLSLKFLEDSGDCSFELSLEEPHLHPVLFGSRSNLPYETSYHSFVGDITCDRWSIAHNRRYLWSKKIYWIYDCNSIKKILEYTGSIHQLRR